MVSMSATRKSIKKRNSFATLTPKQLLDIVGRAGLGPGSNNVLDIVAARVVERSHIPLVVLDGREPENLSARFSTGNLPGRS